MTRTTTQAQIYLADQRGCSETNFLRSYHTFNFGQYQDDSRQPFGSLCLLNDDTLRAGASLTMQVDQLTEVVLLPVVGGLEYSSELAVNAPATDFLEPGQVGILSLAAGMSYTVSNPYETDYINYLQLWLTHSSMAWLPGIEQHHFNFTQKNTLLPLTGATESGSQSGRQLYIGQYGGRQEGTYTINPSAAGTRVFVFVLQGAFEVANRLLHEKDGLALQYDEVGELEFEALSNEAILLLLIQQ